MQKILHITAHMGGGVGNAISNLLIHEKNSNEFQHKLVILDKPIDFKYINLCKAQNIEPYFQTNNETILDILNFDVVILHWWNHPAMSNFIGLLPEINARVILWSHVNGCNYPCLPFKFLDQMHMIFFTTPFSYENNLWKDSEKNKIKNKSTIIYGLGNYKLTPSRRYKSKDPDKFIIGYVGTISKNKIHPKFMQYCTNVISKIPNAYFVIVGDGGKKNELHNESIKYGISEKFEFVGFSNQIANELQRFNVFAYPLNPSHFGTTENALLEAMAAGIPIVALNHNTEKYIIGEDNQRGLLANNINHYGDCIKKLHDDSKLGRYLAKNAKRYVNKKFTIDKNVINFRNSLISVIDTPKKSYIFSKTIGSAPFEWFLTFLGKEKNIFQKSIDINLYEKRYLYEKRIKKCSLILRENNKSSISHFSKYFPQDKYLAYWKDVINE